MLDRTVAAAFVLSLFVPAAAAAAAGAVVAASANRAADSITLFDARTLEAIGDVAVGREPRDVALTADGTRAFVSNFLDATVSAVDVASVSVIAIIPVGLGPRGLAISPDGAHVYVTLELEDAITILRTDTLARVATVKNVSEAPRTVGFDRTGREAWVVSVGETHDVTIVDTALALASPDDAVTGKIIVDRGPEGIAFSLDRTKAYVANGDHDDVSVIRIPSHLESRIPVGDEPLRMTLDPTGAWLYVSNRSDGTVSVIDTATDVVVRTIDGFAQPLGTACSADGSYLFVANSDGATVTRVRLADPASRVDVSVGFAPGGLAIAADPEVTCRLGGVNALGPGGLANVLRVNGFPGGVDREMSLQVGSPVEVAMTPAPDGGAVVSVVLYAWRRPPTRDSVAEQPFGLGSTCSHTPISGASPLPLTLVNSFGREDRTGRPHFGALTAPFTLPIPGGAPRVGNFTLQGFVADQRGFNGRASVTNAIVLRVR